MENILKGSVNVVPKILKHGTLAVFMLVMVLWSGWILNSLRDMIYFSYVPRSHRFDFEDYRSSAEFISSLYFRLPAFLLIYYTLGVLAGYTRNQMVNRISKNALAGLILYSFPYLISLLLFSFDIMEYQSKLRIIDSILFVVGVLLFSRLSLSYNEKIFYGTIALPALLFVFVPWWN